MGIRSIEDADAAEADDDDDKQKKMTMVKMKMITLELGYRQLGAMGRRALGGRNNEIT